MKTLIALLFLVIVPVANSGDTVLKSYDNKGHYTGKAVVVNPTTIKSYDDKGHYTGKQIIQQDNKTVKCYDDKGHLTKKYIIKK